VKHGQVLPMLGTLAPTSWLYGTLLQLACREGYRTASAKEAQIRCGEDGTWHNTLALECVPSRCAPIQAPINGDVLFTSPPPLSAEEEEETEGSSSLLGGLSAGTQAQFSCHEGYQLFGLPSATCLQNQSWSGVTPQCQRKRYTVHILKSVSIYRYAVYLV
jgi:Sushi repeat (SCR repeat)